MNVPYNPDAERSLLSCLLMSPEAINESGDIVAEDFYNAPYCAVFNAIQSVRGKGHPVDLVTVGDELLRSGAIRLLMDDSVMSIGGHAVSWHQVKHYAGIVRRNGTLRRLMALSSEISARAESGDEEPDDLMSMARQRLADLEARRDGGPVRLGDQLADVFESVAAKAREPDGYSVSSGIPKFDAMIGGFRSPQLVIIAARPGIGKTALAGSIALRAASRGVPALIFSLEMSNLELAERFIGADARFAVERISRGDLSASDYTSLYKRAPVLAKYPLWTDDRTLTVGQIEATARRWRLKQPGKQALIIIDYLGLIKSSGKVENRNLEVGAMTRTAKMLAKDLACPVILVSQLNRSNEKESREPVLSDLRDSGEIEAHADMVIFPNRANDGQSGPADLIVPKNRGGKTGRVPCWWHAEYMTYDGLAVDAEDF